MIRVQQYEWIEAVRRRKTLVERARNLYGARYLVSVSTTLKRCRRKGDGEDVVGRDGQERSRVCSYVATDTSATEVHA